MNWDYDSSYQETHTDNDCDICLERVGEKNLKPVPFIYQDKNDHIHQDAVDHFGEVHRYYKRYWVCNKCWQKRWENGR